MVMRFQFLFGVGVKTSNHIIFIFPNLKHLLGGGGGLCQSKQVTTKHVFSTTWNRYRIFLKFASLWEKCLWHAHTRKQYCIFHNSWSRRDVTAYITITIKPKILRILHHDIWGTVSVFIVDLNADIRGGFTNLTADYQKLRLEIGVGI